MFYKKIDNQIHEAVGVVSATINLNESNDHATIDYPIEGWYHADSLDEALALFPSDASITRRQLHLALLTLPTPVYQSDIAAIIAAMPDGLEKEAARIEYEMATVCLRDNVLLNQLAAALGLSSEQVDNLFALAQTL